MPENPFLSSEVHSKNYVAIIFLDVICKKSRIYSAADYWTEYKYYYSYSFCLYSSVFMP